MHDNNRDLWEAQKVFHPNWFSSAEERNQNPRMSPGVQEFLANLKRRPPTVPGIPDQWLGELPDDYTLNDLRRLAGDVMLTKMRRLDCKCL